MSGLLKITRALADRLRDPTYSVAPVFVWFVAAVAAGLLVLDGNLGAFADRLVTPREAPPEGAGPPAIHQPRPTLVADKDDPPPPPPPADKGDRSHVAFLEDTCLDGTPAACKRWAMDAYFAAVAKSKQNKLGRAVRISWFGDSVVATDAIPSRLRARMQTELGDGGPGFVFVTQPHQFCHHQGIVRTVDGGWRTWAISTTTQPDGLYGAAGSTAETHSGKSSIKLVAGKATQAELYYLGQPDGGTVTLLADKVEVGKAETAATAKTPGYLAATIAGGAQRFELESRGKVRMFGISLENASGAVVDNFGIVSVTAKNFATREPAHFASELGHRNADLVLLMIGANEAQWLHPGDRDTKDYQARYEKALAPIRKARPEMSCLVISPLDQAEAGDTGYVSRPVMPLLVAAQRKAAIAQGCAFFSTYDWMGGKGSAATWFKKRYVGSDFQHLTTTGAKKLADAVFDTLGQGYARYAKP